MEQDRAPAVLVHHPELARQTAGQLSRHRLFDRRDNHANRVKGLMRTRSQKLSKGHRRLGPGNGQPQYQARRFPRRMELHDCSIKPIARSGCSLTSPKPPIAGQPLSPQTQPKTPAVAPPIAPPPPPVARPAPPPPPP